VLRLVPKVSYPRDTGRSDPCIWTVGLRPAGTFDHDLRPRLPSSHQTAMGAVSARASWYRRAAEKSSATAAPIRAGMPTAPLITSKNGIGSRQADVCLSRVLNYLSRATSEDGYLCSSDTA
jgi:hypothetical protein